jgi:hypothetical protein
LGRSHLETLSSRSDLARAYMSAEHFAMAVPAFEQALEEYQRFLGPNHPETVAARTALEDARFALNQPDPDPWPSYLSADDEDDEDDEDDGEGQITRRTVQIRRPNFPRQ